MKARMLTNQTVQPPTQAGQGKATSGFQLAFTLVEMLVVITIIGIVAALAIPNIGKWKKVDADAAATRQLLDDIARARQFAISQRSTVYMVFVPSQFWAFQAYDKNDLPITPNYTFQELTAISNMFPRQMIGYNFISRRGVGDQLGQDIPRYLSEWRTLPEGVFIATNKFTPPLSDTIIIYDPLNPPQPAYPTLKTYTAHGFESNSVPFPMAESPTYFRFPSLAFKPTGQMDFQDPQREEEIIPLARGKSTLPLDANKRPYQGGVVFDENPVGNSTNAFTLIVVDRLTGRARVEHQTPL